MSKFVCFINWFMAGVNFNTVVSNLQTDNITGSTVFFAFMIPLSVFAGYICIKEN